MMFSLSRTTILVSLFLLTACAGTPAPDWQMEAKSGIERSTTAYLEGNDRVEQQEFALAYKEVARTGKIDLLARLELTRCAARVASLILEDCAGFTRLRQDASAEERAYADYLAGTITTQEVSRLPTTQRSTAAASSDTAAAAALQGIDDPFARLIAAGVLFRSHRATPTVLQTAVDTASAQGWQRPLLAWLNVQAMRAEQAGAAEEAQRIRRRMALIESSKSTPR
ncbi:MAG: hypothetical protein REI95_00730 [Oxalicibacterium faecigallinarum]|uniref:hypothetical protein n=1 Tax=Oxalicibacterium faecigallinarum TaxID=573741 RepID=UPI002806A4D0|nr:hypothetical protein [Oxalicibacterium faecigallinarum]MDQ7968142.1 hypothetical protein [Oxalicibacterium faecigallinarum]